MNIALLYEGSFFSVLCIGDICVSQRVPQYKSRGRRSKYDAIWGKHKAFSVTPLIVLLQLTCWPRLNC